MAENADAGRIASNRFLQYVPTSDAITTTWVEQYLLSAEGVASMSAASPGSADRNRTLSMAAFEARRMRNPFGRIALATGSALLAGILLVIAYLAAGAFVLSGFLGAVFLIGERAGVVQHVFAPIAVAAAVVLAAASWGLAMLGVGAWWLWRKRDEDEGPGG